MTTAQRLMAYAKEACEDLKGNNYGSPNSSGYYPVKTLHTTDENGEDLTLNLIGDVIKYKKHEYADRDYFGIYNVVEIENKDNICDSDYIYTKSCSQKELYKAFKELFNSVSDKEMYEMYRMYKQRTA